VEINYSTKNVNLRFGDTWLFYEHKAVVNLEQVVLFLL